MAYLHDDFGYDLPLDYYREVGFRLGAKVYRETVKIALNAIFSLKLKHFWYTIGTEAIRRPLYARMADRFMSRYGNRYTCYKNGYIFSFYKIQD